MVNRMYDEFNRQIFISEEHINKGQNNYISEKIKEKDVDNQMIKNSQKNIDQVQNLSGSFNGLIQAFVTIVSAVTITVTASQMAPKATIYDLEIYSDRIKFDIDIEQTSNPYKLVLESKTNKLYEITFSNNVDDYVFNNLEEDTKYILTLTNDYGLGETKLEQVEFYTKTKSIIDLGKISVKDYNLNNNILNLNFNINDKYQTLYEFKYLIRDSKNNKIEIESKEYLNNIEIDISSLNKGILTFEIYSKDNINNLDKKVKRISYKIINN